MIVNNNDRWRQAVLDKISATNATFAQHADIEQFSHMLDDGLLLVDVNQTIIFANAMAAKLFGKGLVNRQLSDVLKDIAFDDILENIHTQKRVYEFSYTYQKTVTRQFRIKMTPINDGETGNAQIGNAQFGVLIMDMTLQRNLDKVRRDFVANVSHELRSPLTSLIGFIETMTDTPDIDEETRAHFLSIMDDESKRMTRLIDDLISLSRVEVDEHIQPDERVNLDAVMQSVIANLKDRAHKQDRTISYCNHNLDSLPIIQGDTDEITEVFHNLIENALKYGFVGTDIAVALSQGDDGKLICTISNIGEGIEERHIPRLTERFYRVDKARSRQKGGTGLGLAIVKHIINRHRGEMVITSQLGQTTTFAIHLPPLVG